MGQFQRSLELCLCYRFSILDKMRFDPSKDREPPPSLGEPKFYLNQLTGLSCRSGGTQFRLTSICQTTL
ncbi:hypothetical protein DsansV1_C21g0167811 [Dioscorea sansibarensis]